MLKSTDLLKICLMHLCVNTQTGEKIFKTLCCITAYSSYGCFFNTMLTAKNNAQSVGDTTSRNLFSLSLFLWFILGGDYVLLILFELLFLKGSTGFKLQAKP